MKLLDALRGRKAAAVKTAADEYAALLDTLDSGADVAPERAEKIIGAAGQTVEAVEAELGRRAEIRQLEAVLADEPAVKVELERLSVATVEWQARRLQREEDSRREVAELTAQRNAVDNRLRTIDEARARLRELTQPAADAEPIVASITPSMATGGAFFNFQPVGKPATDLLRRE